ncbi:MAG: ABC transporter permease [Verrucomicrobiota bacterium]
MDALLKLLLHFAIPVVIIAAIFIAIVFFVLPRKVRTIFKRELASYFNSPVAYVLFVVFLGISNTIAFFFTGLLEGGEADLFMPYFQYLPWYLVFIAPTVGMRLWSEEQRLGTMELLLTMPLSPWHAILGKFLAAAVVIFGMLVLSFPIVWTINYLGDPDNGVIFSGFIATFLVALCFLSVTCVISALTRSQFVALLVSVAICLTLWLSGLPQVSEFLTTSTGGWAILYPFLWLLNSLGVMPHYTELAKGVLAWRDISFFLTFIAFCLFATSVAIRLKRA